MKVTWIKPMDQIYEMSMVSIVSLANQAMPNLASCADVPRWKKGVSRHVTGDFGLIGCVMSLETFWMHCFSWFRFVVKKMSVVHWLSGFHMKNSLSLSSTLSKNFCGLHLPLAVTLPDIRSEVCGLPQHSALGVNWVGLNYGARSDSINLDEYSPHMDPYGPYSKLAS